jgi:hypothetical protein
MLDVGMCYAYCLSSYCLVFGCIVIFHRGLHLLAAPALFHHLINGTALLLFYKPSLSTGVFSAPFDPQLSTLGVAILGSFGVVHWNYCTCRAKVQSTVPSDFQKGLQLGLDRMDSLHGMLNLFRYVVVGACCYYSSIAFTFESSREMALADNYLPNGSDL